MTPKRFLSTLCLTVLTLVAMAQPKAKYVFYFIGDGMGVNQVNAAETFLAAREGRIGMKPLCFTQFPYLGLVSTYSASSGVTDSAAAGTALASGVKTKNAAVGVLPDLTTPVNSVAWHAQQHGWGSTTPRRPFSMPMCLSVTLTMKSDASSLSLVSTSSRAPTS